MNEKRIATARECMILGAAEVLRVKFEKYREFKLQSFEEEAEQIVDAMIERGATANYSNIEKL